jgi:hypothetical protein
MSAIASLRFEYRFPAAPAWRACVCLLLIALVLYNPFAAANTSSGSLSYDNLARHRASIGSGELDPFSPVSNADLEVPANAAVILPGDEPAPCAQENRAGTNRQEERVAPLEPALLAGFWFRPPPAL